MKNFTFWQRWLFIVTIFIAVFGLLLALFNQKPVFDLLFNNQINPAFWGVPRVPLDIVAFQGWIYGVLGATVCGWGVMMAFIAHYPFRRREKWARNCLALGLIAWYLVDTALSIYFGVTFNALFNTVLVLAAMPPIYFTRKVFTE